MKFLDNKLIRTLNLISKSFSYDLLFLPYKKKLIKLLCTVFTNAKGKHYVLGSIPPNDRKASLLKNKKGR